jgi:hypothetical protein
MKLPMHLSAYVLAGAIACLSTALPAAAADDTTQAMPQRDGQHDFDFNFGVWKTHIRRMLDPLSGSTRSMELNGTVTVRKIWGGRGQVEEIEADGPQGHWQGMTLFLYNPGAHQWSQTFADMKDGVLTTPLIGSFKDSRGELYSPDTVGGRTILVRGVWSDIAPNSHHFQEDYSEDGGKTWVAVFIASLTRIKQGDP